MENRGKFIVIDGTDGSGKTTQLEILKDKLESEGHEVKVADFPQYNTKSAGMVEEYLSGKYGQADEVGPYKASIFYAVDRFDASEKIKKWLRNGKIVLANRYTSASLGHQGGKIENSLERRLFFNWLYDLEYKIFEIPKPDLTIVLQVEPEISFKLAKDRNREDWKGKTKDIHENNLDHLKKAEQTYIEIASSLPDFKLIKCTHNEEMLSPEAIHFLVWLTTSQIIKKKEQTKNFQAIGSIMGSNKHIVNNRELILNKETKQNNNITTTSEIIDDLKNNNEDKEEVGTKITKNSYDNKGLDTSISDNEIENKKEENHREEELENKVERKSDNNGEKKLKVEKINNQAVLPKKGRQNDAAYDLFSNDYYSIPAYGQALVSTGIKMEIPNNHAGLIWDKSGLANEGITTMGGVIDSSYRGEIKVVVKNLSEDIFNIIPGQKIAQILIQKIEQLEIEEGKINNDTDRQDKAFGSTGKF